MKRARRTQRAVCAPAADRRPLARRAPAVRDARFRQGAFFDPADVIQVKYEMLRRHHVEGTSVTELAALFGVSRETFYRVAREFHAHGLLGLTPAKPVAKTGPRGAWKITEEVVAYAVRRRGAKRAPSLVELAREVERRFGVRVSSDCLRCALSRRR
jgi:transposase